MKQLQGFVRRAAALVLAAVLCLCAPAALAAAICSSTGKSVVRTGRTIIMRHTPLACPRDKRSKTSPKMVRQPAILASGHTLANVK